MERIETIDKIKKIQLGIWGPEEILRNSVVEVLTHETYENGVPKNNGLFDLKMGTVERGQICATCKQDNRGCNGHFGHIELAKPVYNVNYFATILKILKMVCVRCSKLLINKNDPEVKEIIRTKKGKARFTALSQYCPKSTFAKVCQMSDESCNHGGCGMIQPTKFVKENIFKLYADFKMGDTTTRKFVPCETVLNILKNITNDDCEFVGFSEKYSRPEWMIQTIMPVPPPHVRPSVRQEADQKREDDLTHKLADIIKTNNMLKQKLREEETADPSIPRNPKIIDEWVQLLQYHCATLLDNELPGLQPAQQRSGRPLKSLRQRLQAKEGRLRGNLMGKRCDFTARSVISPDANIDLDQLGVPISVAMNLTIPEIVTKDNIEYLTKLIINGPSKYPGAKTIQKANSDVVISLSVRDGKTIKLEIGDVVNRHILDNDLFIFNRQPSLHKMSMMGHRVVVLEKGLSFRLNVSVTSPYNADFDGDEMNAFTPQSTQSICEIKYIAHVPLQIVSPQKNGPVIGIVQDGLTGVFRLTQPDVEFSKHQFMQLLYTNNDFIGSMPAPSREINRHSQRWTSHQLISTILPPMNYGKKGDTKGVSIQNGRLFNGVLDKNTVGKGASGGLIHLIWKDFGPESAKNFIYRLQRFVNTYLLQTGYSVGMSDVVPSENVKEEVHKVVIEAKEKVKLLIKKLQQGIYTTQTDKSIKDDFEFQVKQIFDKARDDSANITKRNLTVKSNRMVSMTVSGAKGDYVNMAQMIACLAQQNVDNTRIPQLMFKRTLPHFAKDDQGPEARGFIENSFVKGLSPSEFFFHAMSGRIGLIDTAVKTAEVGYIQRKLVKSLEDVNIKYDGTVRSANGNIIQFSYGFDGYDPSKLEKIEMNIHSMSQVQFDELFKWNVKDDVLREMILPVVDEKPSIFAKIHQKEYRTNQDIYDIEYEHLLAFRNEFARIVHKNLSGTFYLPVNINRMIEFAKNQFPSIGIDMNPEYVITSINAMIQKMVAVLQNNNKSQMAYDYYYKSQSEIIAYILSTLSIKQIFLNHRLNKIQFDYVLTKIMEGFVGAIINPGEMVGIIASQSIGEVVTQMTLNTFHFSGISSKSQTTTGVPRLKELLNVTKNIRTPEHTVYLREPFSSKLEFAKVIQQNIQFTQLGDLVESSKILYDPNHEADTMFESYEYLKEHEKKCPTSPWYILLKIRRDVMYNKNLTMFQIYKKINEQHEDVFACLYTDDNDEDLYIKLAFNDISSVLQNDNFSSLRIAEKKLMNTVIQGIDGITNAFVHKQDKLRKTDLGEYVQNKEVSEFILYTEGTNFEKILCHPQVNPYKTITNNIHETLEVLGIEAARTILCAELENTINSTAYVNMHHIYTLADIMTHSGELVSIDRHGVKKSDIGPLARASFEETVEQLMRSSVFAEHDKVRGVSANIMLGQVAPAGTGEFDIFLDETKLIPSGTKDKGAPAAPKAAQASSVSEMLKSKSDNVCMDKQKFSFGFQMSVSSKAGTTKIGKSSVKII